MLISNEHDIISSQGSVKIVRIKRRAKTACNNKQNHFRATGTSRTLKRFNLPPCSMSESVRCVREKLAILAGDMEKRE